MIVKSITSRRSSKVIPSRNAGSGGWRGSQTEVPTQSYEVRQTGVTECRICGHRNAGCTPPWFKRGSRIYHLWCHFQWEYPRMHKIKDKDGNEVVCIGSFKVALRKPYDGAYYGAKP